MGDFTVECLELPEDVLFEDGEAKFNVDVVVGLSLERCFKGGDDGDDLGGDGLSGQVRELLLLLARHGRLADLLHLLAAERPFLLPQTGFTDTAELLRALMAALPAN